MLRCAKCSSCCDGSTTHRKDSSWSWIVCLSAATNLALTAGLIFSFGALLPVFMEYFEESRERTAWIGSLSLSLMFFISPFVGSIINRFGCRVVCITGCLCCSLSLLAASFAENLTVLYVCYACLGAAASCVFLSSNVFVKHCFDKRRSIAIGLASTGLGVGTMVFGPVLSLLAGAVGWRHTLRIISGVLFLNSFSGLLFDRKMETTSSEREDHAQGSHKRFAFHFSVWKVPSFRTLAACGFVYTFGRASVYIHLVKYSEDLGISPSLSSRLLLYLGLNVALGRFVGGFLCSIKKISNWHVLQGVLFLNGTSTMLVTLARNYEPLVFYTVIFGLGEGALATVVNIQAMTCVDPSMTASSFGFFLMVVSVTFMVGPPVSGIMADKFGTYVPAFLVSGGCLLVASFIPFSLLCVKKTDNERMDTHLEEDNAENTKEMKEDSDLIENKTVGSARGAGVHELENAKLFISSV